MALPELLNIYLVAFRDFVVSTQGSSNTNDQVGTFHNGKLISICRGDHQVLAEYSGLTIGSRCIVYHDGDLRLDASRAEDITRSRPMLVSLEGSMLFVQMVELITEFSVIVV